MPSAVEQVQGTFATTNSTTLSLSYTKQVAPGNALVAWAAWGSASATCALSDSVNGTWLGGGGGVVAGSLATGPGAGLFDGRCQFSVLPGTDAGTPNVTMTVSASVVYRVLHIMEVSFADVANLASLVNASNGVSGNSTAPAVAATPTKPGSLVISGCYTTQTGSGGNIGGVAATPWQLTDGNVSQYRANVSVTTSQNSTYTNTPTGQWLASIIVISDLVSPRASIPNRMPLGV